MNIFNKFLSLTAILFFSLLSPANVFAEEKICVTQYGGNVVCSNTPVVHVPVDAGVGDINFIVLGMILLIASGVIYFRSKRTFTV